MIRTALFLALAAPAHAESQKVWPGYPGSNHQPSIMEIGEPTVPNAVATVTFDNQPVHWESESFALTWEQITVAVQFDWNVDRLGSERITIQPPDGYVAVPRVLYVGEDVFGVVHIYAWEGM